MNSEFARLGVPTSLVAALEARGITHPTPIQAATLPDSLAGRDVLGRGRTGSGKTFAFLLPLVTRLLAADDRRQARRPRALVLAPTRELATQIHESLQVLEPATSLRSTVVFGGVGQHPQAKALERGVDVLIACPGRLLDLMGQRLVDLSAVQTTVIDEADHMSDMGFLPGVRRILRATPERSQRLLFSATLDAAVGKVVDEFLHDPVTHEADPEESPVDAMDHHVLRIPGDQRLGVLAQLAAAPGRTIIFTRTKHGARKLAKQLVGFGVPAVELHGNLSQNARTRNLDALHSGRVATLVATDIAARGIHVDDVSLVVHADPPVEHKAYLHRSGRTARAGAAGTVVTLELPGQRDEVRTLLRRAKIRATITDANAGSAILDELAPGKRWFLAPDEARERVAPPVAPPAKAPARKASGSTPRAARRGGQRAAQAKPDGSPSGGRRRGGRGRRPAAA